LLAVGFRDVNPTNRLRPVPLRYELRAYIIEKYVGSDFILNVGKRHIVDASGTAIEPDRYVRLT